MSQPQVHILCAADSAFLRHVPVMLASVRANTDAPLKASVVSIDWRPQDQDMLRAALPDIEMDFLSITGDLLGGLPFKAMLSPLTYARILMPDLVESDRFLYLDVDMIMRDDIAQLWSTDLGSSPAAAVFHNEGTQLNAGLMLVNAQMWRDRKLGATILDWARENQPKEADQTSIEAVISSEMLRLDPRWNRLVDPVWGKPQLEQANYLEGAANLHFITGFKPWNLGRLLLPRAYTREWQRYVKKTGLQVDWKSEARTLIWQVSILIKRLIRK